MNTPLRVLVIEDSPSDVGLVLRQLRNAGFEVRSQQVQSAEEMTRALHEAEWDLVVCDYLLPDFDAPQALRIYKESGLDIPFMVVSGNVGEDMAVAMMKAGAHDYLRKDQMGRFIPAVQRELCEAQERQQRRQAEANRQRIERERDCLLEQLRQDNEDMTAMIRVTEQVASTLDLDEMLRTLLARLGDVMKVNLAVVMLVEDGKLRVQSLWGATPAEAEGYLWTESGAYGWRVGQSQGVLSLEGMEIDEQVDDPLLRARGAKAVLAVPLRHQDQLVGILHVSWVQPHPYREREAHLLRITAERCAVAVHHAHLYLQMRHIEQNLRNSEARYRQTFNSAADAIFIFDLNARIIEVNQPGCERLGYSREELLNMSMIGVESPSQGDITLKHIRVVQQQGRGNYETAHRRRDGKEFPVEVSSRLIVYAAQPAILSVVRDITTRRLVEDAFLKEKTLSDSIIHNMPSGIAFLDNDMVLQKCNAHYAQILRTHSPFNVEQAIGRSIFDIMPGSRSQVCDWYLRVRNTKQPESHYGFKLLLGTTEPRQVTYWDTGVVPMTDALGHQQGLLILTQDVTERHLAEEALFESENRFRSLFESMIEGAALHEMILNEEGQAVDYRIVDANPAFTRHTGIPVAQARGALASELYQASPPPFLEAYARVAQTREPYECETYYAPLKRYFAISAYSPKPGWFATVFTDISGRKQAEARNAALLSLEQRLNTATTVEAAGRIIVEVADELLGWDACLLDLYSPERDLAIPVITMDMVDGKKTDVTWGYTGKPSNLMRSVLENGARLILRDQPETVPGGLLPFGDRGRPSQSLMFVPIRVGDRVVGILSIQSYKTQAYSDEDLRTLQALADHCRSAIERTQSVREVLQAKEDWERTFDAVPDMISIIDSQHRIVRVNRPMAAMLESTPDFCAGLHCYEVIHGTKQPPANCPHHCLLEDGQYHVEEMFDEKRGTYWMIHVSPLRDDEGELQGSVHVMRDITERKRAEVAIREQARMLDLAQDAIVVRDLEDRVLYWNQSAERLFGWTAQEMKGASTAERLYRNISAFQEARAKLLEQGVWSGELQPYAKDGKQLTVSSRWTLVRDAQNRPTSILSVNTDLTEKKQLESQFLHAQRLESIGTLASGIAHDLNNILTPLTVMLPVLRDEIKDPELVELLNSLDSSAQRGADIIRQILTFARSLKTEKSTLQTKHLIKEFVRLIKETFPKSITIQQSVPADLWMIEGDSTQLHQVLMNLCVNARDAMPHGGTLSILAENIHLDDVAAGMIPNAKPGPYLAWVIADSGVGIPAEHVARIFDPFYTTKEVGKGTGLGLSSVMGIVRGHGGCITVESRVNHGTQFRVYLPAVHVRAETPAASNKPIPAGQGQLILVVDDEEVICKATERTFMKFNYRVMTARDGAEALGIYAKHQADISLVLTDLMMPTMDGAAMIRAMKQMNPDVLLIAGSGLMSDLTDKNADDLHVAMFLRKPYSAQTLLEAVDKVLREHGPAGKQAS